MKKIVVIFIPFIFSVFNGYSQSEEIETNIDSITVFLQKCNYLSYEEMKLWEQWNISMENEYLITEYNTMEDSSFIENGVIQTSDGNFLPCQIVFNFKTYHFENECKIIKIVADIQLEDETIARKVFVQTMCPSIVQYEQKNYFFGQPNTNKNILNECVGKIKVRETSILIEPLDNREVIIVTSIGQQIFNAKLQNNLTFNVSDIKSVGLYFVLIKDNNTWCSSKFLKN